MKNTYTVFSALLFLLFAFLRKHFISLWGHPLWGFLHICRGKAQSGYKWILNHLCRYSPYFHSPRMVCIGSCWDLASRVGSHPHGLCLFLESRVCQLIFVLSVNQILDFPTAFSKGALESGSRFESWFHSIRASPSWQVTWQPLNVKFLTHAEKNECLWNRAALRIGADTLNSPKGILSSGPFYFPVPDVVISPWLAWVTGDGRA